MDDFIDNLQEKRISILGDEAKKFLKEQGIEYSTKPELNAAGYDLHQVMDEDIEGVQKISFVLYKSIAKKQIKVTPSFDFKVDNE